MKIDMEFHIHNGRVMLKGKTYDELNDDEKEVFDGVVTKMRAESEKIDQN